MEHVLSQFISLQTSEVTAMFLAGTCDDTLIEDRRIQSRGNTIETLEIGCMKYIASTCCQYKFYWTYRAHVSQLIPELHELPADSNRPQRQFPTCLIGLGSPIHAQDVIGPGSRPSQRTYNMAQHPGTKLIELISLYVYIYMKKLP